MAPKSDVPENVEGETNPVEGETNPVEGENNPVEGENNPVEGETAPVNAGDVSSESEASIVSVNDKIAELLDNDDLIEQVKEMSIDDLEDLKEKYSEEARSSADKEKGIASYIRKIERHEKKKEKEDQALMDNMTKKQDKSDWMERDINIIVIYLGQRLPLTIKRWFRLKQVREKLRLQYGHIFTSDAMLKRLEYFFQGNRITSFLDDNDKPPTETDKRDGGYSKDNGDDKSKKSDKKDGKKDGKKDKPSGSGASSSSKDLNKKNHDSIGYIIIVLKDEVIDKSFTTFRFFYEKDTCFKDVANAFDKVGIRVHCVGMENDDGFQFNLCYGQSVVSGWETITSFQIEMPFELEVRMCGGAWLGVQKHHTKQEAFKHFKSKATTALPQKDEIPNGIIFSPMFIEYLNKLDEKKNEVAVLFTQDIPVMKVALRSISDEKLKTMKEMMEKSIKGGRGESSHSRFLAVMEYLFPHLQEVEYAAKTLKNKHIELQQFFLEKYIDHYGEFNNGLVKYGNTTFLGDITSTGEIGRRETERVVNSQNGQAVAENGNCVIF
eukprot:symbB.v1.2.042171.t1/scaffold9390.1/size3413/1